jgi:hypothetical protein
MLDGDLVCRSVLFPRCAKNGQFDETALVNFTDVERDGSFYALSVASRFILRDETGAHNYGIRTADAANRGIAIRTGRAPLADEEVHYVGFYDLLCGEIRSVPLGFYSSQIRWVLENGENAHFQIEWRRNGKVPEGPGNIDKKLRKDRTAARTLIASKLRGPFKASTMPLSHLGDGNFELAELPRQDGLDGKSP